MKTTITCGHIGGELLPCNDEMLSKLELIFSNYLDETGVLPNAALECEISLTFADSSQIAEINEEYREIDDPTDVLSFPMWENENGNFEPPDDWVNLPLGDIVICPEIAAKNAVENGKSAENEIVLLICHGFLHLLGHDHANEEQREEMWHIQDSLAARFFAKETNDEA